MLINGERALAYIVRIDEILPIQNADKIEVARVGGWQVVVGKDEFKVGDLVVYIEIDSRVPNDNPHFSFLQDRKYKVKSIKLRGQVSQGLIMPMSILPEGEYEDGTDVTKILGIKKIEEEKSIINRSREDRLKSAHPSLAKRKWFKRMMRYKWFRKLAFKFLIPKRKKSGWPAWIIKTDEERVQNMLWVLQNKNPMIVTEKLDGTSTTFSLKKEGRKWKLYVCSRNVVQDTPDKRSYLNDVNGIEGNTYWEMAKKYDIENVLKWLQYKCGAQDYVTLQGETIGEGIQKNKYNLKGHDIYFFNLIVDGERYRSDKAKTLLTEYNIQFNNENTDLKWVPIIDTEYILPDTFEELMDYATGVSKLRNTLREGYVFRNYEDNLSFKCVSNDFLLKWKE